MYDLKSIKNKSTLLISADNNVKNLVNNYKIKYDKLINLEFNTTDEYLNELVETINNKELKIILYSNTHFFGKILPYLKKNIVVSWIYSNSIANLASPYNYFWFKTIFDYYNRKIISKIIVLDEELFKILDKQSIPTDLLKLNIKSNKTKKSKFSNYNTIGIIATDYDVYDNIYNQLSACTFFQEYTIKLLNPMIVTKKFCERFNIKYEVCNSFDDIIKNNYINLYCSFSNTEFSYFIKSMDMGIPCILGNTNLLNDNNTLKEMLVLKSDDDINEITEKIKNIKNNYNLIMKEYKKWRTKYEKNN
ncbi:MAG: hypothetical protein IJO32_06690 [Bacilli bacterium]|nr:hypothetical protein [Bacilli bacterium]